jgi:transposase
MNHWLQDVGIVPPRPAWYANRYHEQLIKRMNRPKNNTSEVVRFRNLLREILAEKGMNISTNEIYDIIHATGYDGSYTKNRITPMVNTVKTDIERGIDDEKIVKLYETLSSNEIADMLDICSAHVIDRLRQNGVQIRSTRENRQMMSARIK